MAFLSSSLSILYQVGDPREACDMLDIVKSLATADYDLRMYSDISPDDLEEVTASLVEEGAKILARNVCRGAFDRQSEEEMFRETIAEALIVFDEFAHIAGFIDYARCGYGRIDPFLADALLPVYEFRPSVINLTPPLSATSCMQSRIQRNFEIASENHIEMHQLPLVEIGRERALAEAAIVTTTFDTLEFYFGDFIASERYDVPEQPSECGSEINTVSGLQPGVKKRVLLEAVSAADESEYLNDDGTRNTKKLFKYLTGPAVSKQVRNVASSYTLESLKGVINRAIRDQSNRKRRGLLDD